MKKRPYKYSSFDILLYLFYFCMHNHFSFSKSDHSLFLYDDIFYTGWRFLLCLFLHVIITALIEIHLLAALGNLICLLWLIGLQARHSCLCPCSPTGPYAHTRCTCTDLKYCTQKTTNQPVIWCHIFDVDKSKVQFVALLFVAPNNVHRIENFIKDGFLKLDLT